MCWMLPRPIVLRCTRLSVFYQLALCLLEQDVPFFLVVGLIEREERVVFANEQGTRRQTFSGGWGGWLMSSASGGRTLSDHVVRIIHTLVLDKDVELDEEPCTAGPHESLRCPGVAGVALWLDLWRMQHTKVTFLT